MPKVDDELTRRLRRAERPVEDDGLFEGLERRRSHRKRLRKVQAGMLAFAVLAATVVGFVALRSAFQPSSRGPAIDPGLAPPNGLIVFSRVGDDGRSHLFTARPDGTGVEQLTHGARNEIDAALSPDGQWITLVRSVGDSSTDVGTVPFDDPDIEPVEPRFSSLMSPEPAWSADSSMIAVREGNAEEPSGTALLIVPLDGESSVAHLAGRGGDLAHPSWGPGSRIVFTILGAAGERETGWDLGMVSSNGTGFRSLVAEGGDQTAPTWSFDGSRIAYLQLGDGGHEIWTIAPDGTDKTLIATAVEASLEPDLAWAPDGSAVLVSDGEWIYRVSATPEGDPRDNFEQLVRGVSPSWQPIPVTASPSASPEPSVSPEPSLSPEPEPAGHDIGLGFRLCHVHPLGGLDLLGDGPVNMAWTGSRVTADGRCSDEPNSIYGVAVDLTGDGLADAWSGDTIEFCFMCRPFAGVDFDADGDDELAVMTSEGSMPTFAIYAATVDGGEPRVTPILAATPGHPSGGHQAGQPLTFTTGGDAGFSGSVRCENFPDAPVVVTTWSEHLIEGDTKTVHETKLVLDADGAFHVVDSSDYEAPVAAPVPGTSEPTACGVDWELWD
jgi:Tol biopolymer transport system component